MLSRSHLDGPHRWTLDRASNGGNRRITRGGPHNPNERSIHRNRHTTG
jgi:hypothetical protein